MVGFEPAGTVEIRFLPGDFWLGQSIAKRLQARSDEGLDLHEGRAMRSPLVEGEQADSGHDHKEEEPRHRGRDSGGADVGRFPNVITGQIRGKLRPRLRRRDAILRARAYEKPETEGGEDKKWNGSPHFCGRRIPARGPLRAHGCPWRGRA